MDENRSSQQNQDYDPEKDGYNPDRIYDAPKGYRPKERQHGFYTAPLADDENTGKKTYYPGFIVSVIGVILAFVSMVLSVTALILSAVAILSSGALLMFTSCSALLHCTAFVLY